MVYQSSSENRLFLPGRIQPNRVLFLAIPRAAFESLFDEAQVGEVLLQDEQIRLFIYEPETKEIIRWLDR